MKSAPAHVRQARETIGSGAHAQTDFIRKGALLSGDEQRLVARWRRLRMSWDHIARNLGRRTPDVRASCDPTWPGSEAAA